MRLRRLFLPIIMSLGLVSCDFTIKTVSDIQIEVDDKVRCKGDTFDVDDLTATVYYSNSETKEIKYENFSYYELDAFYYTPDGRSHYINGDFLLDDEGQFEVVVTYNPISKYKYGCTANTFFYVESLYVPATSLNINTTSLSLTKGSSAYISYSILPKEASTKAPTFTSNDSSIAIVDQDGLVWAIEEGQCIISVVVDDIKKECLVTVNPSNTTDYVFTSTSFESSEGQWTYTYEGSTFDSIQKKGVGITQETTISSPIPFADIAKIEFECASESASRFSFFSINCGSIETYVDETKIASGTLAQANATYKAEYPIEGSLSGTVKLKVKPNQSQSATIYIRSISITANKTPIYPTSIALSGNNTMGIGESDKLTISYEPVDTNRRNITWSSSNEDVLTVDVDGTIFGHKVGAAIVTATAETEHGTCSNNFTINVIKIPVESIELDNYTLSVYKGQSKKVNVTINPVNASNKNVTFTSSNPNIATVDANGNITGAEIGECNIVCTSQDDPTITKTCRINVIEQPAMSAKTMSYNMTDYIKNQYYDLSCAPSVGNIKLLVIPVWFNDSSTYISSKDNVRSDIQKAYFGTESETGWHSVKTFYEEESGGKLTITGCVSDWYSCGKSVSNVSFSTSNDRYADVTPNIVKSATDWYFTNNPSDSRTNYDYDKDGYLDGVILIYGCPDYDALNGNSYRQSYGDNLWAYTYWIQDTSYKNTSSPGPNAFFWASYDFMYSSGTFASKRTGKSTYGTGNTSYCSIDTHTFIHEMGHIFGLEDYYDYSGSYCPAGGFSMQDYNVGGHDPYSCLVLGWAEAYIPTEDCEIELEPFQSSHKVILLSPSWNEKNSPFDEYLLIELYTPTGLNAFDTAHTYSSDSPDGVNATGIRLWHVDSRLVKYSSSGTASASNIYNYPVNDCDFAMSNTYYSSSTADYVSPLGRSYANYNLLQFIRNSTSAKYNPTDYQKASTLFGNGSSFNMTTYKSQFVNSTKLNSKVDLGWSFSVSINGTGASAKATITLNKQ